MVFSIRLSAIALRDWQAGPFLTCNRAVSAGVRILTHKFSLLQAHSMCMLCGILSSLYIIYINVVYTWAFRAGIERDIYDIHRESGHLQRKRRMFRDRSYMTQAHSFWLFEPPYIVFPLADLISSRIPPQFSLTKLGPKLNSIISLPISYLRCIVLLFPDIRIRLRSSKRRRGSIVA